MSTPVLESDSLKGVFAFSRVRDRRNLSCVSMTFKDAFDNSRHECSKIALACLIKERRARYEFPVVRSYIQRVSDCLPENLYPINMKMYLFYQIIVLFSRHYDENKSFLDFVRFVRSDSFASALILKMYTLRLLSLFKKRLPLCFVVWATMDNYSRGYFENLHELGPGLNMWEHLKENYNLAGRRVLESEVEHWWDLFIEDGGLFGFDVYREIVDSRNSFKSVRTG